MLLAALGEGLNIECLLLGAWLRVFMVEFRAMALLEEISFFLIEAYEFKGALFMAV